MPDKYGPTEKIMMISIFPCHHHLLSGAAVHSVLWCDWLVFFFRIHELNKSSFDFIQPETSKARAKARDPNIFRNSLWVRSRYWYFIYYFVYINNLYCCYLLFPCFIFNEEEKKSFLFLSSERKTDKKSPEMNSNFCIEINLNYDDFYECVFFPFSFQIYLPNASNWKKNIGLKKKDFWICEFQRKIRANVGCLQFDNSIEMGFILKSYHTQQ